VEADPNSSVPCVAWEITPEDEAALDRYEGLHGDPPSYRKISVEGHTSDGKTVSGFIYVMTPERRSRDPRLPREDYFQHIAIGYQGKGIDPEPLIAARQRARSSAR